MGSDMFVHQWSPELQKLFLLNPFLVLLLLVLFSFLYLLKLTKPNKLNLPPSPPRIPIIGNFHQVGALPHQSLASLSNKYGPIMLVYYGSTPTLVVSSAELVSEIMKINEVAFSDRPKSRALELVSNGYKNVAFSPHDENWRHAKKICVHELLSQNKVKAFWYPRGLIVATMIEKIRDSCRGGSAIDLQALFLATSNNMISSATLGRVYDREDGRESFAELAKRAVDFLGAFCFEDWFPYLGWIDFLTGYKSSLRKTVKDLYDFLDQVIKEHQVSENEMSDVKDFVHVLLDLQEGNRDLTHDRIKAIVMDMFLGGTATTSASLEWAMAELMKNKSKMKKAQEEVRRVVGEKSKVEESDIHQMDYLKCVVKETLRLHPASPVAPRAIKHSTKLGGYDIPPRINMMINIWAIQRDPTYWDRPEEFIPERFENNLIDFVNQNHRYIPFGGGRRMCPGMCFVNINVEFALANLLYWFNWEMPDGAKGQDLDMTEVFAFVNRKKMPLHLRPAMHYLF